MNETEGVSIGGLVDLAAKSFGGRAVAANDDFFAAKDNLLEPGRGQFIPDKFTDNGKWMDGWESRRKRRPGHDHCIIELGQRGSVLAVDIDTNHFLGNHPPFASLEGLSAARGSSAEALSAQPWHELLPQSPLRPGSQNLFVTRSAAVVSHVRLNIFPDGGVARLRVYGHVQPDWSRRRVDDVTAAALARVAPDAVDLAALDNGGMALACSDAFFAPMHHLILPGRAENQGGGWETRRKRAPGHDWIILRLAARGRPRLIEIDTNHFKGNYPDRCALDVLDAPAGTPITELIASERWVRALEPAAVSAHERHFFHELRSDAPATHVRLCIYPDGGVSRLRVWGERDG
ncbi:MAG TPA: allantoicase [Polyangiaceae bacterium]|nr:allantoicase [Polyangiaceae bacterium]